MTLPFVFFRIVVCEYLLPNCSVLYTYRSVYLFTFQERSKFAKPGLLKAASLCIDASMASNSPTSVSLKRWRQLLPSMGSPTINRADATVERKITMPKTNTDTSNRNDFFSILSPRVSEVIYNPKRAKKLSSHRQFIRCNF